MSALYDNYTVIGSKIKVTMWKDEQATSDNDPTYTSLILSSNGTPPANAIDIREQPNVAYTTMIAPQRAYKLTKTFSAKKHFGKSHKNIVGEADLMGTPGTDPTEGAFFVFSATDLEAAAIGETDALARIHYNVEIIYKAVWTNRKEISQS